VLIITFIALVCEGIFLYELNKYYYVSTISDFTKELENDIKYYEKYYNFSGIDKLANDFKSDFKYDRNREKQIINEKGMIILSSNLIKRNVEVMQKDYFTSLKGRVGVYKGYGNKSDNEIIAVSVPIKSNDVVVGSIRLVTDITEVNDIVLKQTILSIGIMLAIIGIVWVFSVFLVREITDPIEKIIDDVNEVAKGNYNVKFNVSEKNKEFRVLADSMTNMINEILRTRKLKNEFISSISHEIKTPLTSIKGWSETISYDSEKNSELVNDGIGIISNESDRLIGLVEELLDFSKYEQNQIVLNVRESSIKELIKNISKQYKNILSSKDVKLETKFKHKRDVISLDESKMYQVLINIVDNAVKFKKENNSKINIVVYEEKENVIISIKDNGIGLTNEDREKIFDKFYKVNVNKNGSGIGLSVVKEIISLHKFEIEVKSELDKYTEFKIIM
jgi:signal transduction histidine kinase